MRVGYYGVEEGTFLDFGICWLLVYGSGERGGKEKGRGGEDNGRLRRGSLGCAGFCFCFCGAFFAGAGVCFAMLIRARSGGLLQIINRKQ